MKTPHVRALLAATLLALSAWQPTLRAENPAIVTVPDDSPVPGNALIIEALIDGPSELRVRKDSLYWINGENAKPGRHNGANDPTYVDGAAWRPVWKKNKDSRGTDKSNAHNLSRPIDFSHVTFRLIAVSLEHNGTGIEKRDKIEVTRAGDEVSILIPDGQIGARWYKFALVPGGK